MEDRHLAAELAPDSVQVAVDLAGAAANDVVQGVPCGVMRVAEETVHQERPHPAIPIGRSEKVNLHLFLVLFFEDSRSKARTLEGYPLVQSCNGGGPLNERGFGG